MERPSLGSVLSFTVSCVFTGILMAITWQAYLGWKDSCVTLEETRAWVEELKEEKRYGQDPEEGRAE